MNQTEKILDSFFHTFTPTVRPLLLLDYDGTLAPFRVDRFRAVPWPRVREVLNQIQALKNTRMVVVTGRPAEEIWPLLSLNEPVEVWGLHGFERLHADGRCEFEEMSEYSKQTLAELHSALRRDSFGGHFEAKPNAAVMHWRGIPAARARIIEQRTRALFDPIAETDGFRLLPFEAGVELRVGRDKGGAVTALLAETPAEAPAAYLGDDLTDESAFRAINTTGLSALVRPERRPTEAKIWLRPPAELLQFLQRWRSARELG